jgi:hypothetical protein
MHIGLKIFGYTIENSTFDTEGTRYFLSRKPHDEVSNWTKLARKAKIFETRNDAKTAISELGLDLFVTKIAMVIG